MDISSSFETWYRALAGLPSSFAQNEQRGKESRTLFFVCMIVLDDFGNTKV